MSQDGGVLDGDQIWTQAFQAAVDAHRDIVRFSIERTSTPLETVVAMGMAYVAFADSIGMDRAIINQITDSLLHSLEKPKAH